MTDAIDDLAARQFTPTGQDTSEADQQQQQEASESMAKLEAGAVKVLFAVLKIARTLIAKKLPEILEEWPDSVLKEPATAAVPVLKKYLDRAMMFLGSNPEVAAFCMALVPLGMGYIAAADRHDRTPMADVVTVDANAG